MTRFSTHTVTRILGEINAGRASMGDLLPVVYADLQRLASISRVRHGEVNTLHTTAYQERKCFVPSSPGRGDETRRMRPRSTIW